MTDIKLMLDAKSRDVILMHLFVEIRTANSLLATILGYASEKNVQEVDKILLGLRKEELTNVFGILSKYPQIDVPGWRRDLGLADDQGQ